MLDKLYASMPRLACCAMCSSACLLPNASISFAISAEQFTPYRHTPDYVAPNDFTGPVGDCLPVPYCLIGSQKRRKGSQVL